LIPAICGEMKTFAGGFWRNEEDVPWSLFWFDGEINTVGERDGVGLGLLLIKCYKIGPYNLLLDNIEVKTSKLKHKDYLCNK
jgi:hypothetical protein